jgi:DNA-binding XRE family transcriptional regulator
MEEITETTPIVETPQRPNIFVNSIKHGSIIAAITVGLTFIMYIFNVSMKTMGYIQWSFIIVIIGGMVLGTKNYRDHHQKGFMTYGRALWSTFSIAMVSAFITSVYTFIFYQFYAPEQLAKILEQTEQTMIERNPEMTQEQLDMAFSITEKFMNPAWMSVSSFFGSLFFGFVLALIVSIFLKKKDKSFESNFQ